MIGLLPGSTIEVELSRRGIAEDLLAPMFLAGGLVLSQVAEEHTSELQSHQLSRMPSSA